MRRHLLAPLVPALLLSACTSFSGAPAPVITTAQAQTLVSGNLPNEVITRMAPMTPDQRTIERNRVVASYLMAADAKYDQFRRDISQNMKGGNVAFDLATLGLTGLASQWKRAADELAAGATVIAGGRASLNRELYFEKTLPTLLSLMDSSRLIVRSDILKGLAQPETVYTIQDAYSDIWRYQAAASIDGAIQQAAAAASDKAKEAEIDYARAVTYCTVPQAVATERQAIMWGLEDIATQAEAAPPEEAQAARKKIQQASVAAGVQGAQLATDVVAINAQLDSISDYLLGLCDAGQLAAFKTRLANAGVSFGG
jgi:hypothetical protein